MWEDNYDLNGHRLFWDEELNARENDKKKSEGMKIK